jgi:uncharacterized membrane protein
MKQIRKAGSLIAFAGLVLLLFLFLFDDRLALPVWVQVIGRMHPLLLHFPIVLLLLSLFSYWLPKEPKMDNAWELIRLFAAITAIITSIMGLFLSIEEAGKGDLLTYHRWGGIGTAVIAYILYAFHEQISSKINLGKAVSVGTALLLLLTGHWGSGLTHGENFLLAPIETAEKPTINLSEARIYPDVINIIIKDKCGGCHQGGSQKGELLLKDSLSMVKGGKTGAALVAGDIEKSLLLTRIHLPVTEKKHMPVSDKPQLTEEEINLLEAWIKAGAPFEQKLTDRAATDSLRILAEAYIAPFIQKANEEHFDFTAAGNGTIEKLNNNYRVIKELGKNSPALAVSFYGKAMYSGEKLKELEPLSKQIIHLNLAKMPVTDEQVNWISKLPNLRRLNLNYADISDSSMQFLASMKNLELVSVAGTAISVKGLNRLLTSRSLKEIYVWDSKIKSEEAGAAQKKYPQLLIDAGFEGADTMLIALNKPIIKTGVAVFYDSILVEIAHPIKGVDLRYSTNGKEPDSINSPVYTKPIAIQSNTELQVKAYKKGWLSSEIVKSHYLKSLPIIATKLLKPADEKYGAGADKILTDLDLGDITDFGTKWLGYRKNEALFVFDLGKTRKVKEVSVNSLQNLRPYLFPPVSLTVWGSNDEKNWRLLKTMDIPVPKKLIPVSDTVLQLRFTPTDLRYIKLRGEPVKHLPAWHTAKGQPGWFFLSEVLVN